ncbi:hypothetical protein DFJ77DRAFT_529108 [Powellomyces hirtus]|nr:hypothetical protein DFJ77DRAFT_529108 [Powellomyces hirtus]
MFAGAARRTARNFSRASASPSASFVRPTPGATASAVPPPQQPSASFSASSATPNSSSASAAAPSLAGVLSSGLVKSTVTSTGSLGTFRARGVHTFTSWLMEDDTWDRRKCCEKRPGRARTFRMAIFAISMEADANKLTPVHSCTTKRLLEPQITIIELLMYIGAVQPAGFFKADYSLCPNEECHDSTTSPFVMPMFRQDSSPGRLRGLGCGPFSRSNISAVFSQQLTPVYWRSEHLNNLNVVIFDYAFELPREIGNSTQACPGFQTTK